ncbi:MAG: branched-chain amino acid transaminase [Chitinophagaceae bacterium]|nr:branched-chain amino acid transaminase [Chitinophagaceae bacterium]
MNVYYHNETIVYLNGEFIKASEAKVDLYCQTLHYGYGVFEGIRSYKTSNGSTRIFKAKEHFERMKNSARLLGMPYPWHTEQLIQVTYELLKRNQLQDAYIRPLVYAPANMVLGLNEESFLVIEVWPMKPYLGEKLLRIGISSYCRPHPKSIHPEAKACGHYVNSILASAEMKSKGYDEALMLDVNGYIAEAPGANVFLEKEGKLFTPPPGHILPGITRATIMELCMELNIPVEEKPIHPEELRRADAVFYCGTAAEVIGWESVEGHRFSLPWHKTISSEIQKAYKEKVTLSGRYQPQAMEL